MDSKVVIKKILVLVLFLVIIGGVFLLEKYQVGEEYFEKIKSVLSELNPLKAGIGHNLPLAEDSGLDFSEFNLENLVSEEEASFVEEEGESSSGVKEGAEEVEKSKMTLTEIEEDVAEIAEKTEEIDQEVERLSVLAGIEQDIDKIAEEAEAIAQEVSELRALAKIKEKVDKITEETEVLSQEVVREV